MYRKAANNVRCLDSQTRRLVDAFSFNAVQRVFRANKQLLVDWRGGRVNAFVQLVRGYYFKLVAVLDDRDRAASVGEVDVSTGRDWGCVNATHARNAGSRVEWLTRLCVHACKQSRFTFEIVKTAIRK